jgi:tryptophan-rich sensory protein
VGSGRWVTTSAQWYLDLQQPAWQPPGAVFGLAWAYNFTMLAVVGVVVALRAPGTRVAAFLAVFAVTVVCALVWAYLFYVPHELTAAAVWLTVCALLTVVMVAVGFAEQWWLGALLVPYQVWLLVAASLSWGYAALNR